jgi:subtilisin-like proprotein convertase family protein
MGAFLPPRAAMKTPRRVALSQPEANSFRSSGAITTAEEAAIRVSPGKDSSNSRKSRPTSKDSEHVLSTGSPTSPSRPGDPMQPSRGDFGWISSIGFPERANTQGFVPASDGLKDLRIRITPSRVLNEGLAFGNAPQSSREAAPGTTEQNGRTNQDRSSGVPLQPSAAALATNSVAPSSRPGEPLYTSQGHFGLIGRLGFSSGANSQGIERVWADWTGHRSTVGVWDDGIETSHWDLAGNIDLSRRVTTSTGLNDGLPVGSAPHGTAIAGLIAGMNNGRGGVGIAFNTKLTSVRIFGNPGSFTTQLYETLAGLSKFDITNHSYTGTPTFMANPDTARFESAARLGRSGLGTINVKGAGNTTRSGIGEDVHATRFTVSVGATNMNGQILSSSAHGSHILVSAPAANITTDRIGTSYGYNGLVNGDYTNIFGGTSAASAVVSGVVSLMLDANPALGWRDVQNILAYSSIGSGSIYGGSNAYEDSPWKWTGADNWNGGGLHYSENYGYGVVNAFNAVRMAEAWGVFQPIAATSANELAATGSSNNLSLTVPIVDNGSTLYSFTVQPNIDLDHVTLGLKFTHSQFTDLRITLQSPSGMTLKLLDGTSGTASTSDYGFSYDFGLDGFRGTDSAGTWTLRIDDVIPSNSGTLTGVNFTGYGSALSTDDVYHYTDEAFTVQARPGMASRLTLTDADGGTDWVNASAMVRNLDLSLAPDSTSSGGGTAFLSISAGSTIENAIGGDGNDRIVGNGSANILLGMRGDDSLEGGSGADTLNGGAGNDTLIGGLGGDRFRFDSVIDGGTVDRIIDFTTVEADMIELGNARFTTLSPGTLAAQAFLLGSSAATSEQRILYDGATGLLAYDQDGSDSQYAPMAFAQLSAGLNLTNNQFVVT